MAMIHLIRHARPVHTGLMLGQYDSPLADDVVAPALEIEVARVYTSPLRRALRTAELFFPLTQAVVLDDLAEISLGEWDGQSWSQIEALHPGVAAAKLRAWNDIVPPAGEPWPEFVARVARAWTVVRSGPSPCAIVAHAGVNSVLARLIAGRDPLQFHQQYGEVTSLEIL